jgi:hypothetical protein
MVNLAISILLLLIGVIVLAAVIYFALSVIRRFFPGMDQNVDYAVWVIFAILIAIYCLTLLEGGGGGLASHNPFR